MVRFKVGVDPIAGLSTYEFRTYGTGFSLVTGLGVADDLKSLMVFSDPSALGSGRRHWSAPMDRWICARCRSPRHPRLFQRDRRLDRLT